MLTLYNPDSMEAQVNIAESSLPFVTTGDTLNLRLPTYEKTLTGTIRTITPAADATSRSYRVALTLPVEQREDQVLLPGMFTKVTLSQESASVLFVPANARYQIGQLDYVKIVEDNQIKTRLVVLTQEGRVRKGLKSGDTVLINPKSQKNK